jgi:hypothetical protein
LEDRRDEWKDNSKMDRKIQSVDWFYATQDRNYWHTLHKDNNDGSYFITVIREIILKFHHAVDKHALSM